MLIRTHRCATFLRPIKNRKALVEAIVRDLDRAFVDSGRAEPVEDEWELEEKVEKVAALLPSPKKSPQKKKKGTGMTAEQVKNARDLCTTCHSTIKFLSAVFSFPAISRVFTGVWHSPNPIKNCADIFYRSRPTVGILSTGVLAIPIADEIPTPNARKTCALTIWLLQVQRLPSKVLLPASDRIAYALRRGLDGELGKEGKKDPVSR